MNDGERDPVLRRAIDELRKVPAVDPEAVRRVIHSAAVARVTPAEETEAPVPHRSWRPVRRWAVGGLVAAAAIIGFVARGVWMSRSASTVAPQSVAEAPVKGTPQTQLAARNPAAAASAAVPQQFMLRNVSAHRVSVVGDFNGWSATSAPMTPSSDGELWSAIILITPGRHLYGFMIDDSLFVLDPRAPKARDPDLGSEGSVLMVGRP